MRITERRLRRLIREAIKENFINEAPFEQEQENLFSFVKIFSPVFGHSKSDVESGKISPKNIAVAKAFSTSISSLTSKDKKACSRVVFHELRAFETDQQGKRLKGERFDQVRQWKTCDDPEEVKKIVTRFTDKESVKDLATKQLKKDIKTGECKKIDGEYMYEPWCYTKDSKSVEIGDVYRPNDLNNKEKLKKAEAEEKEDFLVALERVIKSKINSKGSSLNNSLLSYEMQKLKSTIDGDVWYYGLKNSRNSWNKLEELNKMWNESKGSKATQDKITEYIQGTVSKDYDKDKAAQDKKNKQKRSITRMLNIK